MNENLPFSLIFKWILWSQAHRKILSRERGVWEEDCVHCSWHVYEGE